LDGHKHQFLILSFLGMAGNFKLGD
jgi:hypothetical protein